MMSSFKLTFSRQERFSTGYSYRSYTESRVAFLSRQTQLGQYRSGSRPWLLFRLHKNKTSTRA